MRTPIFPALVGFFLATVAPAADITFYNARTKKDEVLQEVTISEESTAGVTVVQRGKPPLKISALDIRWVRYTDDDVKPVDSLTYNRPFGPMFRANRAMTDKERTSELRDAIKGFNELLPKLMPRSRAQRHAQFTLAQAHHRLAQMDPDHAEQAVKVLGQFRQDHLEGWQVAPALMMLAQLQEDRGDLDGVQKTYEDLASVPGISEEIRQESLLSGARALLRSEKYDQAAQQFEKVRAALPPDSPNLNKVQILLAQCQVLGKDATRAAAAEKQLRELIGQTTDTSIKALAHNTLGDYFQKNGKLEEAFWEYLRVDVMFNEDRHEHARALFHLAKLFRQVKQDAVRADDCQKLLEDRKYSGTEFQKKATMK